MNIMRQWMILCETRDDPDFADVIDTLEFKAWFNGSKIVDRNGKPLVVWHGVKNPIGYIDASKNRVLFSPPFAEFDVTKRIEPGAWFSPDRKVAELHGVAAPFFLHATSPIREEGPIIEPPPGHDAIYRTRSARDKIWDAWEIAVFDPRQIRLAFNPDKLTRLE